MKPMTKDIQVVQKALQEGKVVDAWSTEVKADLPEVLSIDVENRKVTLLIARGEIKEYDIDSTMAFNIED